MAPPPRSPLFLVLLVAAAAAFTPATAQRTVRDILLAVPDCAPFAAALQRSAPDIWDAAGRGDFNGSILCPGTFALAKRPLPANNPAAAEAIVRYHVLASPLPPSPKDGEEFVTFLANARIYASRRGGGPIVHLIGGGSERPSSLAPLPVDNTASVLGVEAARSGPGKGVVALVDIVLQPPASAVPAGPVDPTAALPSAAVAPSTPTAAAALQQTARVLTPATMAPTTPTPAAMAPTADGSNNATAAANGTDSVRVDAAGGSSIIPKKLKKKIVKVVRRLLP